MNLYSALSCCTSKAPLRYGSCVTRGSHSFTCHPHTNHTCLYSPDARRHPSLRRYQLILLGEQRHVGVKTCPEFLRRVPGQQSYPRLLDHKFDTLPTRHDANYVCVCVCVCVCVHCRQRGPEIYRWTSKETAYRTSWSTICRRKLANMRSTCLYHCRRLTATSQIVCRGWYVLVLH